MYLPRRRRRHSGVFRFQTLSVTGATHISFSPTVITSHDLGYRLSSILSYYMFQKFYLRSLILYLFIPDSFCCFVPFTALNNLINPHNVFICLICLLQYPSFLPTQHSRYHDCFLKNIQFALLYREQSHLIEWQEIQPKIS